MKTCTECGVEKNLNQFLRDGRIRDGLCKLCIACMAAAKGYTQEQYEDLLLTGHVRGKPGYYANHRDKELAYRKDWGKSNPDSVKRYSAKYHRENPQVSLEAGARRRARLAGAEINDFTEDQWSWLKEVYEYRCAYCGEPHDKLEKDHVIPLSREGDHTLSNIVPACPPCNRHKSYRTPSEAGMKFAIYVDIEFEENS